MEVRNFFKAVAVMAIAVLCTGGAYAQNESINGSDTTRVAKNQVINKKAGAKVTRVRKVVKTAAREDSVIYKGGQTEVYQDRQLGSLSLAELRAINAGETKAVKRANKNYDGQLRRYGYVGLAGGIIGFDPVDPMAGAMVGYRTWNFDFSLTGFWTNGRLPQHSDQPGAAYNSVYFYLDGVWRALHTSNGYWAFGPGVGIGYGSQKTNWLNTGGSTNSGVTGRAFLVASYQATNHLSLQVKAGALLKVSVNYAVDGTEWQEISKNTIKPFIEGGLTWRF
jgi:hypothetical protein